MKLRAFLALALLAAAPAGARERPASYECGEERVVQGVTYQSFAAHENGVHWYLSFPLGSMMVITHLTSDEARDGFLAQGMDYPDGGPTFLFTYHGREPVAVDVRTGNVALPVQPLGRDRDGSRRAHVPAALVMPLLAAGEGDLIITFYDRRSQIVLRTSVPVAQIRAALAELPPMLRRVREKMADPANLCVNRADDIIVT